MSVWGWLRQRSRQKRRKKAAKESQDEPMREFVYLDEVSVFSLLASRIGALATDFSESESSSLTNEVMGSAGVSVPVANADVSSKVRSDHTSGTQVMRKSTVQSTFKELYQYVRDSLVLGPPMEYGDTPLAHQVDDLLHEAEAGSGWAIEVDRLKRGHLLEVEVELDADESFRASTIMSTLLEFINEMPELPDTLDRQALVDATTGARLLEKLLAGLVPLRGKVIDYSHLHVAGRALVVHKRLLSEQPELAAHARPLYMVGVAEGELFWRDIRRVLFSGAQYRILGRLGRDGIPSDWTPVKLMHVLERTVPALQDVIEQIPSLLENMGAQGKQEDEPSEVFRYALQHFAQTVTTIYGRPMKPADLAPRGLPTIEQCEGYGSVESRRAAFASLTDVLVEELRFTPEPEILAACRAEAQIEAQLLLSGPISGSKPEVDSTVGHDVSYLDCEIVAIYW